MTSALIGASSVAQLEENLAAAGHTEFTDDELAAIDRDAVEARHQHLGRLQRGLSHLMIVSRAGRGFARNTVADESDSFPAAARSAWLKPIRGRGSQLMACSLDQTRRGVPAVCGTAAACLDRAV